VLHTGDFKMDQLPLDGRITDLRSFARLGEEGVDLFMVDSTNAEVPGFTTSEQEIAPVIERVFHESDQRIIVACFASHVHRVQQVLDAAVEHGRKVGYVGRSMVRNMAIARDLGYLDVPPGVVVDAKELADLAPEKQVLISTGSQGEPLSALARIAQRNHNFVHLVPGDTVVLASSLIPGNENAVYRVINGLARLGANVVHKGNALVHVSGHASAEECKLLLNLLRPKYFLPIHGEYRQMSIHASHAQHMRMNGVEESFILETGDTLEIDKRGARKGAKVQVGRVCIDSGSIDEFVDDIVIRDRRHLSEDGFVLPIIAINKHSGKAEGLPEIVSRGFMSKMENGADLMLGARQVVAKTLESSSPEERGDWGVMQEKIRADLKRFLTKATSRRPLIMPVILEV